MRDERSLTSFVSSLNGQTSTNTAEKAIQMRRCVTNSAFRWESVFDMDQTRTFLFLSRRDRCVSKIGVSLQLSQRTAAFGGVLALSRSYDLV